MFQQTLRDACNLSSTSCFSSNFQNFYDGGVDFNGFDFIPPNEFQFANRVSIKFD